MKFDYEIIQECANSLTVSLFLAADMDVFNGHFETLPILPAVAQIYMVEKIAQTHFGDLGSFIAMQQVKFMSPILPAVTIDVTICFNPHKQLVTFEYRLGNEIKSKGKLQYAHNGNT